MNKRMILMLVLTALLFGGIFGYKAFVDQIISEVFDTMEPEVVTISTSEARSERWTPTTEAVGTFAPVKGAELTVEIGGIVREIHFENGQQVEAGQRLVSLDTRADEAELARLAAALRLAELDLSRQQKLLEQQSVSRAELDRAESEAEQARAAVAAAQAVIDQKTLKAPFSGRAGIRQVNPGQYISPGTAIVSLQSLDPIFIDFTLPQRRLPLLDNGLEVAVAVDAYPDESFAGQISAVEPRLSESTRTVRVQATLDNAGERLRPGMFGRVELALGEAEERIVVPQTALRFSTYGDSVFVVEGEDDDKRVVQRFVRTGITRGDLIAIRDGLEVGDEVASSGLLKLQNDSRVRIDNDEDSRPTEDADPRPGNG
ncbi:MAG: efflux RND transporter periplasmic adaptor subunit [Wenzhouxiangella sp.]|nr:MAG: efflux RND transporter periplasmic adaptor subunit [Wenzhouxiangella sp.]